MSFPPYEIPSNWLSLAVAYHAYAYGMPDSSDEYSFSGDISDSSETSWDNITWMDARTQPTYAQLSDPAFKQEVMSAMGTYLSVAYEPTDHAQLTTNTGSISTLSSSLSSLASTVSGQGSNKVDKTTTVNGHALSSNVTVTKTDVSLGNCDNTSDASKPISSATQTALDKKPTIYFGSTLKSNAIMFTGSATVSSGTAVIYLTTDGTSGGTAIFPNGPNMDSINAFVSDAAASYQMSYALTNSNKTLTITANKLTTANILTGVLGQGQANSAVVRLTIWGS